ncbi:MAG: 23S rRNA (adenine(2503)-C(2))-methyltransferase RlmN [Bdellovibrionaceae bacterium]|nr:23S rRNA (adenine(2503)-C(2))-methyltransferase RlmN [Pseudobdellovibrionaceae bacterium]
MAVSFFQFKLEELGQYLESYGEKKFRAQQLFRWIYGLKQFDYEEMTNVSKSFRQLLPQLLNLELPHIVNVRSSQDGTRKYLFEVGEGETVEAVLIPGNNRRQTLCLSSEVGCNMACKFCFTGKQKLKRRLSTQQIVGQFVRVMLDQPEDEPITNIVYMGMGEPLDNTDAVLSASEILHNSWGVNLSRKKITVSTSGLVPQIPLVTQAGLRLAVSLNAPNDELRTQIMPINKKYPLAELIASCKEHSRKSKDKVTMEYVLLKDFNDSIDHAKQLMYLLRDVPSKINIIPFNEHPDSGFGRPSEEKIQAFQNFLISKNVHVLRRRTMGRDIYAACGQLTSAYKNHPISMTI